MQDLYKKSHEMDIKVGLKRLAIIFLIIIVATVIFVTVMNFVMDKLVHTRKEIKVPDVCGKNLKDAEILLNKFKLKLKVEGEVFNKDIPSGRIAIQNPSKDFIVRENKEIKVMISKGGESVEIPDIIGVPQRSAEICIHNSGAIVGQEQTMYSRYYDKGLVVRQNPLPKTISRKGIMVHLYISKGEPPINIKLMPKLIGKPRAEAEEILKQEKISYVVQFDTSTTNDSTVVLNQNPLSDNVINNSTNASITVSGTKE
jgi:eukaryotic-like serine/threonine-protein kinase